MKDLYTQLVRDALEILDRYRAPLAKRDHVKSLDDREELLRRVRAALEPMRFRGLEPRDDVTEILRRIDEAHGERPDPSLAFRAEEEEEPIPPPQRSAEADSK